MQLLKLFFFALSSFFLLAPNALANEGESKLKNLVVVIDYDFTLAEITNSYSKFLKISRATGIKKFWYEYTSNSEAVPHMADALSYLQSQGAQIIVLSNRPEDHRKYINRTLEKFGISANELILAKYVVGNFSLYKRENIAHIAFRNPNSKLLLVGDNMEKDSEVFQSVEAVPGLREQIIGVLIKVASKKQVPKAYVMFADGIEFIKALFQKSLINAITAFQLYSNISRKSPERVRCSEYFKLFDSPAIELRK